MQIEIAGRKIGPGQPCYVIAELGINHNGHLPTVLDLMTKAKDAGADAVKFQKRTVELCYSQAELDTPRESPWGTTTRQQKNGLELSVGDYDEINRYAQYLGLHWFASCWDATAVDVISQFEPPAYKLHSAAITDKSLIERICQEQVPILVSTGMSTMHEIRRAVNLIQSHGVPLALLHCTSTYPSKTEELNLWCIESLQAGFSVPVGYSGHEVGLQTTVAAVALGACIVERHMTLDRSMYGSDQAASVEPHGFAEMVRDIRVVEAAMGDGRKRVYESEMPVMKKLRKVAWNE